MHRHEIILHIGHFKTGTTAVQVFCGRNRELLKNQGLVYSTKAVKFDKHSALAFSLLREAGAKTLMHGFNAPQDAQTLWAQQIAAARALEPGQALLVSTEEFMRLAEFPKANETLRAIIGSAPDIRFRAIAYLRAPADHLRSWYNQLVKMGELVGSFDTAVRGQMERIHWDYAHALDPWIQLLGAENVILRAYGPALREGDALHEDFLSALGYRLPITAGSLEKDPNPRLDDRLLPLKRALNGVGFPEDRTKKIVEAAQRNLHIEEGADLGQDAPTFAMIKDTSQAAINRLLALPNAAQELAAHLDDLPEPQNPEARNLEVVAGILAREISMMRISQRNIFKRLVALEKQLGLDEDPTT